MSKKTSWEYAKNRNYKQLKITFDLDNPTDATLYHYLHNVVKNKTRYIKNLVMSEMLRWSDHD